MWLLNESILSRTTPRYLSDCMSSRCVKAVVGGSVIKISAAALCISGQTFEMFSTVTCLGILQNTSQ